MKVILAAAAVRDLDQISDYIARDNKVRAKSFLRELRRSIFELGHTSEAFPFVEGYEAQGIRRRVHGSYLIFYRADSGQVRVLRVLHGARDYPAMLG